MAMPVNSLPFKERVGEGMGFIPDVPSVYPFSF